MTKTDNQYNVLVNHLSDGNDVNTRVEVPNVNEIGVDEVYHICLLKLREYHKDVKINSIEADGVTLI